MKFRCLVNSGSGNRALLLWLSSAWVNSLYIGNIKVTLMIWIVIWKLTTVYHVEFVGGWLNESCGVTDYRCQSRRLWTQETTGRTDSRRWALHWTPAAERRIPGWRMRFVWKSLFTMHDGRRETITNTLSTKKNSMNSTSYNSLWIPK